LAQYFDSPRVGVSVSQYSSVGYYVIVAGTIGATESIQRYPITGNETVLDALAQPGLASLAISSQTLWLARPGPSGLDQILPIDWHGIARGAETATNYQILPGDRLYIVNDAAVAVNDFIGTLSAPVNHLLSIGNLGVGTINGMEMTGRGYNQPLSSSSL
jgi:protein involved in polysaccharide export with SLBB domain